MGEREKLRGGEVGEDSEEDLRGKLEEGGTRIGGVRCIRGVWLGGGLRGAIMIIIWRVNNIFLV